MAIGSEHDEAYYVMKAHFYKNKEDIPHTKLESGDSGIVKVNYIITNKN